MLGQSVWVCGKCIVICSICVRVWHGLFGVMKGGICFLKDDSMGIDLLLLVYFNQMSIDFSIILSSTIILQ